MLGKISYCMPWQLLPYSKFKIEVNSIADQFGIGNNIARNKYIPNDDVKSSANIVYWHSHKEVSTIIFGACLTAVFVNVLDRFNILKKGYSPIFMPFLPFTIEGLTVLLFLFVQVICGRMYLKCYHHINIYHYVPAR